MLVGKHKMNGFNYSIIKMEMGKQILFSVLEIV